MPAEDPVSQDAEEGLTTFLAVDPLQPRPGLGRAFLERHVGRRRDRDGVPMNHFRIGSSLESRVQSGPVTFSDKGGLLITIAGPEQKSFWGGLP